MATRPNVNISINITNSRIEGNEVKSFVQRVIGAPKEIPNDLNFIDMGPGHNMEYIEAGKKWK